MSKDEAKTENQIAIEQLEKQIEDYKKSIKAARFMIAQLKNADSKPFSETVIARGYFQTVKFLTNPLRSLNRRAELALDDPQELRRMDLLEKGEKILDACEEIEDNKSSKAKAMAVRAAAMQMELEVEMMRKEWDEGNLMANTLKGHIERLRPELTDEQKKERDETKEQLKAQVAELTDQVKSMMNAAEPQEPQPQES